MFEVVSFVVIVTFLVISIVINLLLVGNLLSKNDMLFSYKQDAQFIYEKYEHLISQLAKHGLVVTKVHRSSVFIEKDEESEK